MSYCRFSHGDVYLYESVHGGFECCACYMFGSINLKTRAEALEHLHAHRAAGHEVPEYAFDRLREEIEEERRTAPPDTAG